MLIVEHNMCSTVIQGIPVPRVQERVARGRDRVGSSDLPRLATDGSISLSRYSGPHRRAKTITIIRRHPEVEQGHGRWSREQQAICSETDKSEGRPRKCAVDVFRTLYRFQHVTRDRRMRIIVLLMVTWTEVGLIKSSCTDLRLATLASLPREERQRSWRRSPGPSPAQVRPGESPWNKCVKRQR